jgi:hypothetical protein
MPKLSYTVRWSKRGAVSSVLHDKLYLSILCGFFLDSGGFILYGTHIAAVVYARSL